MTRKFLKNTNNKSPREGVLFPKDEWKSLCKWKPVSNISIDEIYKDLPEVKQFHINYTKLWLKEKGIDK